MSRTASTIVRCTHRIRCSLMSVHFLFVGLARDLVRIAFSGRSLIARKGRAGGAHSAAARLGMNRMTLLTRMKKFGIYAKQYG
jgi:hypothetical protein